MMGAPANAPSSGSPLGGGNGGGGGGKKSVTGFDPEGLERAAKAARELDNSKNSRAALEIIKAQEATSQHEAAAKRAEYDAYAQQLRLQSVEKEAEEARKTLEVQTQHDQQRAQYRDELERKRQADILNMQRANQDDQLKKQEAMIARQEEMRRKTLEYEAKLKTDTELARARAEAEGRIKQERVNHDLILEKVKLEATERRDTVLKAIADGGRTIGEGMSNYLEDTDKLRNTAFAITGIALGIYTARTGTGIAGRFIESRLGKPSLVRETSRLTPGTFFKSPGENIRRITGMSAASDALEGVVLEPSLDQRLRNVARSTANTKKNRAPFRHLLLHGPPGTGKTLFAKGLARHSGLEYAILTGGDIAPLGRDAVTELHKLFDWAKTSRRGLLLFVDEADAFLQSRETNQISEDQRNALNAFLYRTGTETDKFMMVYASNQPSQFDPAVTDRIDEMVEFDLPGSDERHRMIVMYIERYLLNPSGRWAKKVTTEDIGEEEIRRVVDMTEGFSGRAISKLAIAWQAAAYGTDGAILSKDAFFETVEYQKRSISQKEEWIKMSAARAEFLTKD
eukprot:CAMPEP_0113296942 /NCGR_PEP_ID=MMETSP0010_2-20120614/15_1 /TAXON_ID=216773 ORGANISM="Corethron hystrix, Strain 308" /NCGR_SAMPLE_ID=MMETSP0010_2 /ASSEMBLY_ACC=CAM_ASM_000155 /LENGTH=568 /DNA_ID=CAMNT_0000149757 /DNA_START=223 /DNA_END=1929 /DNA_ORIENTATION=+ /assembly_acc=CAM_ASM_000155